MDGPLRCATHNVLQKELDRKKYIFALIIGAYCSLKCWSFWKKQPKIRERSSLPKQDSLETLIKLSLSAISL